MTEPTNAELGAKLLDNAAFIEKIIGSQWIGAEIAGCIRLAAKRLTQPMGEEAFEAMVQEIARHLPVMSRERLEAVLRAALTAARGE